MKSPTGRLYQSQPNMQNLRATVPGTPERARADLIRRMIAENPDMIHTILRPKRSTTDDE